CTASSPTRFTTAARTAAVTASSSLSPSRLEVSTQRLSKAPKPATTRPCVQTEPTTGQKETTQWHYPPASKKANSKRSTPPTTRFDSKASPSKSKLSTKATPSTTVTASPTRAAR